MTVTQTSCKKIRRFNLSILECKSFAGGKFLPTLRALIYPYWNVNNARDDANYTAHNALIYPYWNVNQFQRGKMAKARRALIYPYWNVNFSPFSPFAPSAPL